MKLVVDSNIVFAGMLRAGTTRDILIDPPMGLVSPEWMLSEIRRHSDDIARRARLPLDQVELLLALVTESIEVVPRTAYQSKMKKAHELIGSRDPGDVPFVALALAHPCDGVWTQNSRDFETAGVRVWTTADVIEWAKADS